ncbi:hypothetical protein EVAR_74936_1 [Eumeta japonica]|uniref:Uncharacterized protein n=1 Tax=Eumeta variegata TaxID=151549 RepID=A0A4C1UJV3_EUMVA|nr:hypothetical protein EVAR_74936_1 [Eumeta japonica]
MTEAPLAGRKSSGDQSRVLCVKIGVVPAEKARRPTASGHLKPDVPLPLSAFGLKRNIKGIEHRCLNAATKAIDEREANSAQLHHRGQRKG